VHALIEVKTARMSTEELRALLDEHRVPCAPIRDVSEVVDDEQVRANELLEPVEHPRIPGYRDVAFPLQFDGVRPGTRSVPPMAGEHTAEVLAELGYSEQEIASITAGD
jgi:crotonobetainyl-CoA:carnitine CoA-transferase CaiB-like acyl-CoA transferase